MQPIKTLLLATGALVIAGCSLLIDARLDEKGASSGSGGTGQGGSAASSSTTATSATSATSSTGASHSASSGSSSGPCGSACMLANATSECVDGACAVKGCLAKFDNCDQTPENGCETNLYTDANHCSSCGHACLGGESCLGGKCK